MEIVRQKLVESAVIGDVVNNFIPRVQLYIVYGTNRITFGDTLPFRVFQSKPDDVQLECDDNDLEMKDNFMNAKFVIVMTDPERTPGCEYLHWLISDYNATKSHSRGVIWQELVPYEPPATMLSRKIVFTVYYQNQCWVPKRQHRVLFSSRVFASTNALGSPLGAAFYYIKDKEDDPKEKKDDHEDDQMSSNEE
eukprot:PITA_26589